MRENRGLYNPANEHDACGVGFIVRINGERDYSIIRDGIRILCNLEHRGAVGGDQKTGDGAGMLTQIPHRFFRKVLPFQLPEEGYYGAGMIFLPPDKTSRERAQQLTERIIREEGGILAGWRDVPVNPDCLGELARSVMPFIRQFFVTYPGLGMETLERKLFILRKQLENSARKAGLSMEKFYIPSLSSRVIIYKGMFVSTQFITFYPDLADTDFRSALALVHQRYSTNTFPSWPLAQPFRYIAHNGEINTLRRNSKNMLARESSMSSDLFGKDLEKLLPVVEMEGSDSAVLDNVFELLHQGGRSMEHVMMMMVPEAFGAKYHISQDKRSFYEYHAALMEPWDGPAAIAFTDGSKIGATLDRNGLRPGRYLITKTGSVILASESGVLDIPPGEIREKGRLSPGKMFIIDTEKQRVIRDNEIKSHITRQSPYRRWLNENKIELQGLLGVPGPVHLDSETLQTRLKAFGYTFEDIRKIITPMAENGQEPIGSMGSDIPVAVLDKNPVLLFDYFRQLFAQVTNPPIDPYREHLVMSLMSFVGRERNLFEETPAHCRQLKLAHPVLTNDDIDHLKGASIPEYRVESVSILFDINAGPGILEKEVLRVCRETEQKIDQGCSMVILSDREISETRGAIPSLLAVSAVDQYLVKKEKRHLAGLVIESGEIREVHHFAVLISYGASGINPYLVFEALRDIKERGYLSEETSLQLASENYVNSVKKGLLKIMSKMGISTLRSYRGSRIYEAVGLNESLIDNYFAGTTSNIGGIGIDIVEKDLKTRHEVAFSKTDVYTDRLESGGDFSARETGSHHLFSACAVVILQKAVRNGDYSLFKQYTEEINGRSEEKNTLRGLFTFKKGNSIPIDQVESETEIIKRFVSSAMSFGSLSSEAHETIAAAMNSLGAMSNSGEGGEDDSRYNSSSPEDDRQSRVKQIASGRFGVDTNYMLHADELQIKMAQGAKPGEGGQLPGHKVNGTIARVRHSTPGVMLISPPPHHDIYSIEDLSQLIFDLKNVNPKARISVKLVAEAGVGTVAAGVAKGKADMVLISGSDGGTGASPLSSIKHAGSFWEIGLAETQQVLVMNKLRSRIRVQVDGQLKTGRDVVIGALLGAEEFGFGSCALVSLGCVMMRKCHTNACPVGIATQDPDLKKRFTGKPEHLMNFIRFIAAEVREYMAELGFRTFNEMVGQVNRLEVNKALDHYKSTGLDFSRILSPPETPEDETLYCSSGQDTDFSLSLDPDIIKEANESIDSGKKISLKREIKNYNRTVGAMLAGKVTGKWGAAGLPDNSIHIRFDGTAGQSFGAFLSGGITFELVGEANDYFGKGLSGGKLILYPPDEVTFTGFRNIISGNVNLFGATGGEAYINGQAGERFAVRNSGAIAVVEGVGNHGCEYMTGGRVIILGKTGINFAAGMSGGIAYVYDENQLFDTRCNLEMVEIEPVLAGEEVDFLFKTISKHTKLTDSKIGARILENWEETLPLFVKVIPLDYRKALERLKKRESKDEEETVVTEEVFI